MTCPKAPGPVRERCVAAKHVWNNQYQKKHPTKHAARIRRWRAVNPEKVSRQNRERDPRAIMLQNARVRAREAGVPFTIMKTDIVIPTNCPILGIPLFKGPRGGGDNSPSLDKVLPERGYVQGNIIVISNRANRLKADATIEELRDIASFYATLRGGVRVTGASQ